MSFWNSGSGATITGRAEDAFISDFEIIPNGTQASASIKSFNLVEKENKYTGANDKFFNVNFKILDGQFKSREVGMKIKCFSGKPEQIDRNLNMLRLIMQLCDFKLTHDGEPTDIELGYMAGKIVSIKIKEWEMPKADGSGVIQGNFVSEVHASGAIPTETGIKAVVEHKPTSSVESAFSRNASMPVLEADLPF